MPEHRTDFEALRAALDHPDPTERGNAVDLVWERTTAEHGPLIARAVELVADPDPAVRHRALLLLCMARADRLKAALEHLVDPMLAWTVMSLRQIDEGTMSAQDVRRHVEERLPRSRWLTASAAARLAPIAPEVLVLAAESDDEHVSYFARRVIADYFEPMRRAVGLFRAGEWDRAVFWADAVIARLRGRPRSRHYERLLIEALDVRAALYSVRGDDHAAIAISTEIIERLTALVDDGELGFIGDLIAEMIGLGETRRLAGDAEAARSLVDAEFLLEVWARFAGDPLMVEELAFRLDDVLTTEDREHGWFISDELAKKSGEWLRAARERE
ncbi:hypothetical protein [Glycomyces harbinensis]|uniref:Uncharacterized protein n=1 Tax=Glycomyces harbinensis TaxID=58114 RepID=A0A1G7DM74_9ACTN|nr:hypothetical protein [Glycomyces harbinensis]SDE52589.1 hypothetical protein SAMN05216270_12638 [Glycomyces harbinensis]